MPKIPFSLFLLTMGILVLGVAIGLRGLGLGGEAALLIAFFVGLGFCGLISPIEIRDGWKRPRR